MTQSKVAFLSEMGFTGKVAADYPNMRTEFAWMHALGADHHNIYTPETVQGYDHVFLIFPKGYVNLSAEGSKLLDRPNPVTSLLTINLAERLKETNAKVYYIQEGPHWWFNDYELPDQIGFYNMLTSCDAIFAHNESDVKYYEGLLPGKPIHVLPSLMVETLLSDIKPTPEEKVIIGGNFARWYGGFESYLTAREFGVPVWAQTSHVTRVGEEQLINQLPRLWWNDWIKELSTYKYAVHLMPTVAAGTFSLNCAYLGVPCIGNEKVDTQRTCHPDLSVDVDDVKRARELAQHLRDPRYWEHCSQTAKENYQKFNIENWISKINKILK